ncbi:MAG: peroxiredoxin [Thermodesulfobium narugense]|nr:MAG: peroxiredoxin [Thermodesulfobium narugense]
MLNIGDKIDDFCLNGIDEGSNEKVFCFKDLIQDRKNLILYFYPKDNTPGCTTEACDFRDNMNFILKYAAVAGVSPDSIVSHKNFQKKHGLNFPLLSDPEKKILNLFGAYGEKKTYGKTSMGVIRSTFLITPDMILKKAWRNVRAKGHVDTILKYFEVII